MEVQIISKKLSNHRFLLQTTVKVERQSQLAKSLSETLTLYYPLAGRFVKENHSINCNDEGLFQILHGEFEAKVLNRFVPEEVEESATSPLVAIQINIFNCGGLAIGLWFSHRIVDCFTFSMFINGWAKTYKVGLNDVITPNFEATITKSEVVTKRFVFDAKTISKLKAEAMSDSCGLKPSTVEIMAALIWRAQINAIRAKYGHLRTSPMSMPMNFRGRTFDKIPENCCGKLFTWINARFPANDNKMGLDDFVDLVRDAIRNSISEFAEPVMKAYMELIEELRKGDGDLQIFASWRDFPFYEGDFGWGKPTWVSVTQRLYNGIILVDAKDGDGIEIWVTMDVEGMAHFQQDSNITHFSAQFDFGNNRFLLISFSLAQLTTKNYVFNNKFGSLKSVKYVFLTLLSLLKLWQLIVV
ncbi:hypothetical protein ACOSQ2_004399 [Xanthoceras sorbifolium]